LLVDLGSHYFILFPLKEKGSGLLLGNMVGVGVRELASFVFYFTSFLPLS
jgi:hypothetical protein